MLCLAQKDERYKNEKTKKVVLLTAPLAQGGGDVRPIARPKLLDQFQKLGVLLQGELSEIRRQEIVVPGSDLVGVKVCSLNSILLNSLFGWQFTIKDWFEKYDCHKHNIKV